MSDMAVNTTGNKNLDSINTSELCIEAMNFSLGLLLKKRWKVCISKIFTWDPVSMKSLRLQKKNFQRILRL